MERGTRSEAERFYQSLVGGVADERAELFYESLVGEAETADEATPTAPRDIHKDAFFEEERISAQIIKGGNPIINNTKSRRATPPAGTPTGSNPGTGLDLTGVRKVIYFDAFFRGDDPAPGKHTERALKAIHAETGGKARLVIYEVTDGGTPRPLRATWPKGMPVAHLNIKPSIEKFTALALCRVIDMAIKDEYTDAAGVTTLGGKPVLDLLPKLPARGTVGSATGSGTANVTSWCTDAEAKAAAAVGPKLLEGLIKPHKLVGWRPGGIGAFQHDCHLFEFSWEHLVL